MGGTILSSFYYEEKVMKIGKDRKIELQQKIIDELQEENKKLTEENDN